MEMTNDHIHDCHKWHTRSRKRWKSANRNRCVYLIFRLLTEELALKYINWSLTMKGELQTYLTKPSTSIGHQTHNKYNFRLSCSMKFIEHVQTLIIRWEFHVWHFGRIVNFTLLSHSIDSMFVTDSFLSFKRAWFLLDVSFVHHDVYHKRDRWI